MARAPKVPKTDFDHLTDALEHLYSASISLNRVPLVVIASSDIQPSHSHVECMQYIREAIDAVSSLRSTKV